MQDGWLPLFPLEVVLFPRTPLALHIFEDRYKEMIGEVIAASSEFGVVLARDKGVLNVGCTAAVSEVTRRYPDGRLDILTVGRRRFEIILLSQEKTYLRAQVHLFEDDTTAVAPLDTRQKAMAAVAALRELLAETASTPALDDPELSFQLAQHIPDLDLRQLLLRSKSEAERIALIADRVPLLVARLSSVARVKQLAPQNGHAHQARLS